MVSGHAEGEGVGLGEHVVAVKLFEYSFGGFLGHAQSVGSVAELFPVEGDEALIVLPDEGAAELVGLNAVEPSHVHGQLVNLVLE